MQFQSRRSNLRATGGMVATTQPLAAMAGLRALMTGGNAADAAVAAAAALNVVEPHSTGMGGDLFALVRMADDGKVRALSACGRSPAGASLDELRSAGLREAPALGAFSVTVPGAVSGWETLLNDCGRMTLSDALSPAIGYAEGGFPVSDVIASHWSAVAERLSVGPAGGELLLNGKPPRAGQIMRMPTLGRSLRTVAEGGADAFYNGELGERTAAFVQSQGGWLTAEDLAAHKATWVEPITSGYRGYDVWQVPPPSQGVNALMALNIAEGFDLAGMGFQSADAFHHLIESMRLAFADALHYVTDPAGMDVAVSSLLSKSYADERRTLISADRALPTATHGVPPAHSDTVYVSAVDGDGNACSLINSLFMGFGSGLVVPGTGMALHNRGASFSLDPSHANRLEPRKMPFHTLIPGMVTRDGELFASYGVMGAMQQAQGHLQVLANMIDFGLTPQEALDAPRFSVRIGEGIAVEGLAGTEVLRGLSERGQNILLDVPHGVGFGSGQIIARDADTGALTGGSDPRADGFAVGF